jgi:rsbT co-antagonist protein RsbR
LFLKGVEGGGSNVATDPHWSDLKEFLGKLSGSRAIQGFTPMATSTFVFSFKEPLFRRLRQDISDADLLSSEIWNLTLLIDSLGLYTAEVFLKTREDVIRRAQEDMLELSTPVVKLWDKILALPLIGTLDSARTEIVMETLLNAVATTNTSVAILDITGVPTVDTVVAQHLLKTITAVRLMGAECIISGIRPQIAQTIVHLGINLADISTKASLRDALALALEMTGQQIARETIS